jgi:UDP-N-acetylglucosamine--N-acetylmuramyl-(pentapeptide) pyrophosphoryl-undecaprenol N-acetylglucosamine transferase
MKILLVGGGTGGHLFPLVALANQWEKISQKTPEKIQNGKNLKEKLEFHFVVAQNNSDKNVLENTRYSYSEIPVAKLRRYFSWENFRDFFRFIANIFRAFFLLKKHKPDCIFSKGGFVSLPVGLAAKILRIPFYLHETDSVMGLSNRMLAKFSQKIFTGFPSSNPNHIFVGNPVREEFFRLPSSLSEKGVGGEGETKNIPLSSSFWNSLKRSGEYPESTSLQKQKTQKIFIFGGSQGSEAINTWAREFFSGEFCTKNNLEVLLVTGKGKGRNQRRDELQFVSTKQKTPENFHEVEFLHDDFIQKIHNADIVITRAGGSIFELAAAKKCTVLIPLPSAANNHQLKNAQFFSGKNAALLIEERNLFTPETKNQLSELIQDKTQQNFLAKNLATFAQKNVAEKVWKEIENC